MKYSYGSHDAFGVLQCVQCVVVYSVCCRVFGALAHPSNPPVVYARTVCVMARMSVARMSVLEGFRRPKRMDKRSRKGQGTRAEAIKPDAAHQQPGHLPPSPKPLPLPHLVHTHMSFLCVFVLCACLWLHVFRLVCRLLLLCVYVFGRMFLVAYFWLHVFRLLCRLLVLCVYVFGCKSFVASLSFHMSYLSSLVCGVGEDSCGG